MLRPYTPNRKESRSADPRSVRGGAPSFAVTRTLAVDNNPALKAPKSGNGGPFSELGAGHWNSSCRSCVTIFFIDSPAPVFHHAGTTKKESDKGSDVAIMSSKSVAVPAFSVTMLPKSPAFIGSRFGSRGGRTETISRRMLFFVYRGVRRTSPLPPLFFDTSILR